MPFLFLRLGAVCPWERQVIDIKTPVSRVGNKSNLLGIIYALFPPDYNRFVDVFGGSGSVLLGKPRIDSFEVYNDFDGNLVNLFRVMKSRPMALIRELGFCTLNARADFNAIRDFFKGKAPAPTSMVEDESALTTIMLPPPTAQELIEMFQKLAGDVDVRRAAMYLRLLRFSYASGCKSFAAQPFDLKKLFGLIEQMQDRLRNVVVENQDFETLLRHFDREDTLFYCDPPYYSTEDMYEGFTRDDHERLRDALGNLRGKFLLSYNDCPEIRELYAGFPRFEFARPHSMAQRYEAGREFRELLIGNYDLLARARDAPWQLTMEELYDEHFDFEQMLKESVYHG